MKVWAEFGTETDGCCCNGCNASLYVCFHPEKPEKLYDTCVVQVDLTERESMPSSWSINYWKLGSGKKFKTALAEHKSWENRIRKIMKSVPVR